MIPLYYMKMKEALYPFDTPLKTDSHLEHRTEEPFPSDAPYEQLEDFVDEDFRPNTYPKNFDAGINLEEPCHPVIAEVIAHRLTEEYRSRLCLEGGIFKEEKFDQLQKEFDEDVNKAAGQLAGMKPELRQKAYRQLSHLTDKVLEKLHDDMTGSLS